MAREGMDIGLVTTDGNALKTIGDQAIPQVISDVNSIVQSLQNEWWGHDSTAFVNDWDATHRPNLTRIAGEISAFGQQALTNAQQQTTASQS